MKVGDLIKLHYSKQRCGEDASKLGVILDLDHHRGNLVNFNLVINRDGTGVVKSFHVSQVEEVINESR